MGSSGTSFGRVLAQPAPLGFAETPWIGYDNTVEGDGVLCQGAQAANHVRPNIGIAPRLGDHEAWRRRARRIVRSASRPQSVPPGMGDRPG